MSQEEARRAVIVRHARLLPGGAPNVCLPTKAERRADPNWQARHPPVIYPDREAAEAAARELADLDGVTMVPRRCPRSRSGHYHLTPSKGDT